jgi:hypothetical protein
MTSRSISESSPSRSFPAPLFSAFPLRSSAHFASLRYPFFCLSALRVASAFFSGLSRPNCQIPAIIAKSANMTSRLSIILINKCRRADILSRCKTAKNQQPMDRATVFSSHYGLSTVGSEPHLATKSNYSRTSSPFARNPNHSRTYAKAGGGGCLPHDLFSPNSFVFLRHSNYMLNYMDNYIVGAPTFSSPHAARRNPRAQTGMSVPQGRGTPEHSPLKASTGIPPRETSVYCPDEEGPCCNKRIRQKPATSNGLAKQSPPCMSLATLPLPITVVSAGGGSAPSTPRMRPGIPAPWSPVKRAARDRAVTSGEWRAG